MIFFENLIYNSMKIFEEASIYNSAFYNNNGLKNLIHSSKNIQFWSNLGLGKGHKLSFDLFYMNFRSRKSKLPKSFTRISKNKYI